MRRDEAYIEIADRSAVGNWVIVIGQGEMGSVARSGPIYGESGNEKIHSTRNRIDGMRAGGVQFTPSLDVLRTRSFEEQLVRKRQSDQTKYTVPAASISADGNGPLRRFPASV